MYSYRSEDILRTIKFRYAYLTLAIAMTSCRKPATNHPLSIVYDQWWSSDYAANGSRMLCDLSDFSQCESIARSAESDFTGQLSKEFQIDPSCSDIELVVYSGPDRTPQPALTRYSEVTNSYWALQVNYSPHKLEQPWEISLEPNIRHKASGAGDAKAVAHDVCSIVRGGGGTMTN